MRAIIEFVQHLSALIFAAIIAGVLFAFSLLGGIVTAICAVLASIIGVVILLTFGIVEYFTGKNKDEEEDPFV